jgi:hypothetical protein
LLKVQQPHCHESTLAHFGVCRLPYNYLYFYRLGRKMIPDSTDCLAVIYRLKQDIDRLTQEQVDLRLLEEAL